MRTRTSSIVSAALILLAGVVIAVGQVPAVRSLVSVFWLVAAALAVGALIVAIASFRRARGRESPNADRDR